MRTEEGLRDRQHMQPPEDLGRRDRQQASRLGPLACGGKLQGFEFRKRAAATVEVTRARIGERHRPGRAIE